jgi:hypothetical protein
MDDFPFVHQPEAVHFHCFPFMMERKKPEDAPQLLPDHFQKRGAAASSLSLLQRVTEDIVILSIHYVYSILFRGGIQWEAAWGDEADGSMSFWGGGQNADFL